MDPQKLFKLSYDCLLELTTPEGINASGREEQFGCIFGRDSFITILKILRVLKTSDLETSARQQLIQICHNTLLTLIKLQGQNINIESGEEPGKFIHEYRQDKFDHLIHSATPWFVYPDGKLKNYDSVDSTPLGLIAIYRYLELTHDPSFEEIAIPAANSALNWLQKYADKDHDHLIEYELSPLRRHGGLPVQSWSDSRQFLENPDGSFPQYPIAPVEVQGYSWLALKLWGKYFRSTKLARSARQLKNAFNQKFMFSDTQSLFPAVALDGQKNQIKTITGNQLLLLWASISKGTKVESIIEDKYIPYLIDRSFQSDIFDGEAGIRTMSTLSPTFNPRQDSYHNGSFWPVINGMVYEGLLNWNYLNQAYQLKNASLKPLEFFGTPIELYIKDQNGSYQEFEYHGQKGCRHQAWSAASMLDWATSN